MTPLLALLRERIAKSGPIRFHDFMEAALYHPVHGYYRRARDPFGKAGDFYTAEQLQPVFGILIAARVREMFRQMGSPADFTVVELGAGRGEMAEAFREWRYVPVEIGGELPGGIRGVVFSNEFFDALPVEAAIVIGGTPHELRVGVEGDALVWVTGDRAPAAVEEFWRRYCPRAARFEANLGAIEWMARIAAALEDGFHFTIDYGYVAAEHMRFPQGTLMSYRRHQASGDVLAAPGERDITSHVPFSALAGCRGFETVASETLAQTLLRAGERDQFAAALAGATPQEEQARRLQLKSLLFGMGEAFRTLIQRRRAEK